MLYGHILHLYGYPVVPYMIYKKFLTDAATSYYLLLTHESHQIKPDNPLKYDYFEFFIQEILIWNIFLLKTYLKIPNPSSIEFLYILLLFPQASKIFPVVYATVANSWRRYVVPNNFLCISFGFLWIFLFHEEISLLSPLKAFSYSVLVTFLKSILLLKTRTRSRDADMIIWTCQDSRLL